MRGGGQLVSITIEPGVDNLGHTQTRTKIFDAPFVTYAGPWADAFCQREDEGADTPEDFDWLLEIIWENQAECDGAQYQADHDALVDLYGGEDSPIGKFHRERIPVMERGWQRELENHWPVINAVAHLLLAGDTVDHDTIMGILKQHETGVA